jgi:myo-inositol-1(or 4)-monophosphatase
MKEIRETALELARGAGALLKGTYERGDATVGHKSTLIDLVTDADKRSEAYILETLARRFPDHAAIAEESGIGRKDGPWRWIVDPLDGTVNFAHGIPHFAVLIAAQRQTTQGYETEVGVTYDPLREELFCAVRGQGATLNDRPIEVSAATRLIDTIGATGFMYDRLFCTDDNHAEFCRLNLLTQGVRRSGSAGLDLAYVACGRYDFFWEYSLNSWDVAGGALLLTEAGGRITNLGAETLDIFQGRFLASNGHLHAVAARALAAANRLPIGSREGLAAFLPPDLVAQIESRRQR